MWSGLLDSKAWKNQCADPIYVANEKNIIINIIVNYENSGTNECE